MKTIALRYSDNYAPADGTIIEHQKIIDANGYVWYGKFGNKISPSVVEDILASREPKIIFIKSGFSELFYAYIQDIQYNLNDYTSVPKYYKADYGRVGVWFKINKFEKINMEEIKKYYIVSSKKRLDDSTKHCMSSSFIVEKKEEK